MTMCRLTAKCHLNGHKVSHSNIKTKTKRKANVQKKRIFDVETGKWVKLHVSTSALKTLNKKSLSAFLRENS